MITKYILNFQLESLLGFIEDNSDSLEQQDYDNAYKVWSGFDIVARLKQINLGPDTWKEYEVKAGYYCRQL